MPVSIAIAAFVFGSILILIAIIGGEFKLFGSEISRSITNRWLRFFCFFFGAALLVFALGIRIPSPSVTVPPSNELNSRKEPAPSPELTSTPDTTPKIPSPNASDCVITVTHPFAEFSERPSHGARVLGRVEQGKYRVLGNQLASWGGGEEMWYQIEQNAKRGWIVDSPIIIGSKTSSCP